MSYKRKTKDVYFIMWNGEEVDEFESRKEAAEMKKEYNLAFGGGCSVKCKRVPL